MRMKITGLKTFIVDSTDGRGGPQWVFVKVLTDQDGLWGLGEGSVTSKATTIAAAIMEHERFLQGRDPLNIEWLWQQMYRVPRWRGGPVLNSAISAIEIALWDIKCGSTAPCSSRSRPSLRIWTALPGWARTLGSRWRPGSVCSRNGASPT